MKTPYAPSRRPYTLRGRYQNVVRATAQTIVAAHTATAGHVFSWRWDDTTVAGLLGFVRYVGVKAVLTTAFTTDQEVAYSLRRAITFTAAHTNGTAVDVGGTVNGTGKRYYSPPSSVTRCQPFCLDSTPTRASRRSGTRASLAITWSSTTTRASSSRTRSCKERPAFST